MEEQIISFTISASVNLDPDSAILIKRSSFYASSSIDFNWDDRQESKDFSIRPSR